MSTTFRTVLLCSTVFLNVTMVMTPERTENATEQNFKSQVTISASSHDSCLASDSVSVCVSHLSPCDCCTIQLAAYPRSCKKDSVISTLQMKKFRCSDWVFAQGRRKGDGRSTLFSLLYSRPWDPGLPGLPIGADWPLPDTPRKGPEWGPWAYRRIFCC